MRAAEADRLGRLPEEDVQDLKASGYLALSVPREYSGQGCTLGECVEAQLELAKGSTSTALVAAMTLHIFGHARDTHPWTDETFAELCEKVVQGALVNSAASEPELGSPSRGGLPKTHAVLSGDRVIVNGHKTWVTGGEHLDHLLVALRLEDGRAVVWVPNGTPGVRWQRTWGTGLSVRASDSHDVVLEGVEMAAHHLLQRSSVQKGSAGANAWFPAMMAATYLGAALGARDAVVRYALERVPTALGEPIATLPKIQRQLGELDASLGAAQAFLLSAAHAWTENTTGNPDNRRGSFARIAAAKYVATETALGVTDRALGIAGGAGLGTDLPLERLFRDVRAAPMHPPSGDGALELIGRSALEPL